MKLFLFLLLFCTSAFANKMTFESFIQKPKLVVVVVIDQFRADFLSRYQKDFQPVAAMGFNFLMKNGAYFAQSNYEILQAMTCPGHAMILTGSYPAQTGIQINEWYDASAKRRKYCAEDEEFGLSPRRLKTTTYGDEVKNIYPDSKVYTVSLKDRSAIFLGGHRADLAVWYDDETNQWTTSKYYNGGILPNWIKKINDKQKTAKNLEQRDYESSAIGTEATLNLGLAMLENEKLGQKSHRGIDVLAISLSNHDILGHTEGPDSENVKKLTLLEDKMISKLMNVLKKKNLFNDTIVVFTADHGIPPAPMVAQKNKLKSGSLDYLEAIKMANKALTDEFGSSGENPWVEGVWASHIYLNRNRITDKKIDPAQIQNAAKKVFQKLAGIYQVVTREEILQARIPYFDLRWAIEISFVADVSGDLILVPEPFFADKTKYAATHMTTWNYDTTVPLIFWGPRWFNAGIYAGSHIVDIAPTLSFVTGVIPPAKARGRVLSEAVGKSN